MNNIDQDSDSDVIEIKKKDDKSESTSEISDEPHTDVFISP